MRSYELVDPDGIESVSRANQAAAFDRISRSMRSCRTSRRSRALPFTHNLDLTNGFLLCHS